MKTVEDILKQISLFLIFDCCQILRRCQRGFKHCSGRCAECFALEKMQSAAGDSWTQSEFASAILVFHFLVAAFAFCSSSVLATCKGASLTAIDSAN